MHDLMIKHEGLDDAFVRAPLRTRAKETPMFTRRDGMKLALAAAAVAAETRPGLVLPARAEAEPVFKVPHSAMVTMPSNLISTQKP